MDIFPEKLKRSNISNHSTRNTLNYCLPKVFWFLLFRLIWALTSTWRASTRFHSHVYRKINCKKAKYNKPQKPRSKRSTKNIKHHKARSNRIPSTTSTRKHDPIEFRVQQAPESTIQTKHMVQQNPECTVQNERPSKTSPRNHGPNERPSTTSPRKHGPNERPSKASLRKHGPNKRPSKACLRKHSPKRKAKYNKPQKA